jgi:hypothetical protein
LCSTSACTVASRDSSFSETSPGDRKGRSSGNAISSTATGADNAQGRTICRRPNRASQSLIAMHT